MSEFSDPLDNATVLEELARETALAAYRKNQHPTEVPDEDAYGRYCLDRGDVIPPERVKAVSAVRCVHCATAREKRVRRP